MKSLSSIKRKKILIITHTGCDVDAICAASSLLFTLQKHNKAKTYVPGHIALPAKKLAARLKLPYKVVTKPSLSKFDTLLLVDFNDLKMAAGMSEEIQKFKGQKFLIDHHQTTKKKIAPEKNSLVNPKAVASCELVYDWIKKSGLRIDKKIAACIASGLVTDSAYFLTANAKTFAIMADCLNKSEKTFSGITKAFAVKQTLDEKIAKLKAAKRARIYNLSDYLIVTADVGAFEADAASALIKLGADIAFVGDADEGKVRLSGRASQAILKKEKFGLAKNVFQKLSQKFGGSGGGHAGAAGYNGKGKDIQPHLEECLNLTKQFFKKKKGFSFKEYS